MGVVEDERMSKVRIVEGKPIVASVIKDIPFPVTSNVTPLTPVSVG